MRLQPAGRRAAVGRVAGLLLAASVALASAGATARAHDSLAPPGATHTWLPGEKWVSGHWVPFEEQELKRALGLRGRQLEAYLYNDHRTPAALAARRGIAVEALAARLVEPWRAGGASEARMARLYDPTLRILTQGHLAQHVFYHVFHGVPVVDNAPAVFGVPGPEYVRLRARGWRPLRIAHRGGRSYREVRDGMIGLVVAMRAEGIRARLAWPPESDRIFRRSVRALPCWLRRGTPENDPGNPYGKARFQHGTHGPGWPATPAQRRVNDRRAERVRRGLHRSCWRPPPAWRR